MPYPLCIYLIKKSAVTLRSNSTIILCKIQYIVTLILDVTTPFLFLLYFNFILFYCYCF